MCELLSNLVWKAAHDNTVACQFTHVGTTQLPYLSRNTVLFHQWLLQRHQHTTLLANCDKTQHS